jgi:hypothetical protein
VAAGIEHHSFAGVDNEVLIGLNSKSSRTEILQQNVFVSAVIVKDGVRHEGLTPVSLGDAPIFALKPSAHDFETTSPGRSHPVAPNAGAPTGFALIVIICFFAERFATLIRGLSRADEFRKTLIFLTFIKLAKAGRRRAFAKGWFCAL